MKPANNPNEAASLSFLSRFTNNLFGTIAGPYVPFANNMDFIPVNGSGETLQIKGDTVSWLGLRNPQMQKFAYDFCFPVSSVIDRLAEMDLTGELEVLRLKGKGRGDYATGTWASDMNALLARPNFLQSWSQFRGQQVVYKKIFGFCPVLPIRRTGFGPEASIALINLPPWLFDVVPGSRKLEDNDRNTAIEEYTLSIWGKTIHLKPDDLFFVEDSFMQNEDKHFLLPQSKLVGLDMVVSNICAAMEADNVLLKKKGPLGFISHDAAATKDGTVGYLPMTKTEKDELQTELTKYGMTLTQFQYIISRQQVKWNAISFDVKQLGTKETIVTCEKAICHRYNYPYPLYEATESTFSNGNLAAKSVYQDNVIPNNWKDMQVYNKFFKAAENNAIIGVCYDDLPVMQPDKKTAAEAVQAETTAYVAQYKENLITKNQLLTKLGYDTVEGGDIYYKDEIQENGKDNPAPQNTGAPAAEQ